MNPALAPLAERAVELARQFRTGHPAQAALDTVDLLTALGSLLQQHAPHHLPAYGEIVHACLACQQRRDWLGLADWLAGELVELLQACD